jgi:DNA polymerase I-like protein with 3'-5' exonuclease and polymerase domains
MLSAFNASSGRNSPSTSKFIFGTATWLRGLIKSPPGHGVAYVDYEQQEFGIAAALSGDEAMIEAYNSGDPYLAFAKQAGAVPPDGTKQTHARERELFKQCILAVNYGMGADSLALRIGKPPAEARELLRAHRETYRRFWRWSEAAVSHAYLYGRLWTVFGWTVHVGPKSNPRSFANFPMQANGAEMLRLACCFATERGISVFAPVHDAILIEAPLDQLEQTVTDTQQAMSDASALVLGGFRLRSDAKLIRHPDRYMDEKGEKMWNTVWEIIGQPSP